jgi:hypothetical protein
MAISAATTPGQILTSAYVNNNINSGMVYITDSSFTGITSAAPLTIANCFSSTYRNYRIVFSGNSAATAAMMSFRFRDAGGVVSLANYETQQLEYYGAAVTSAFTAGQTSFGLVYNYGESEQSTLSFDVFNPNVSTLETGILYQSSVRRNAVPYNYTFQGSGQYATTTAMTGLNFFPSAGTASGTIAIYGYRQS